MAIEKMHVPERGYWGGTPDERHKDALYTKMNEIIDAVNFLIEPTILPAPENKVIEAAHPHAAKGKESGTTFTGDKQFVDELNPPEKKKHKK